MLKSSRYFGGQYAQSEELPACFLRWSVKVSDGLYAVAATVDGKEYDFVGNFKSVREAQQAGRRYARLGSQLDGWRCLSLKQQL